MARATAWVFFTDEDTPPDESPVRKAFSQALRATKLSNFRLYDRRHMCASLLLEQNAPIHRRERPARPHRRQDDTPLARALEPAH